MDPCTPLHPASCLHRECPANLLMKPAWVSNPGALSAPDPICSVLRARRARLADKPISAPWETSHSRSFPCPELRQPFHLPKTSSFLLYREKEKKASPSTQKSSSKESQINFFFNGIPFVAGFSPPALSKMSYQRKLPLVFHSDGLQRAALGWRLMSACQPSHLRWPPAGLAAAPQLPTALRERDGAPAGTGSTAHTRGSSALGKDFCEMVRCFLCTVSKGREGGCHRRIPGTSSFTQNVEALLAQGPSTSPAFFIATADSRMVLAAKRHGLNLTFSLEHLNLTPRI